MKITAHMKSGESLHWDNVADVLIFTPMWAKISERGESWDMSVPFRERKIGTTYLLNIIEMLYWEQVWDELDEEEIGQESWMRGPPEPSEPGEGT